VTALLIIALVWVGSAVLVVPYLLNVAGAEVQQATAKSPQPNAKLPGEYAGKPFSDAASLLIVERATVLPQIADSRTQATDGAKHLVEA
jgi:hypothetical protein